MREDFRISASGVRVRWRGRGPGGWTAKFIGRSHHESHIDL